VKPSGDQKTGREGRGSTSDRNCERERVADDVVYYGDGSGLGVPEQERMKDTSKRRDEKWSLPDKA